MVSPDGASVREPPSLRRVHSVQRRNRPPAGFHRARLGLPQRMQGGGPGRGRLLEGGRYWRWGLVLSVIFRKANFPLRIWSSAESHYLLG